MYLIFKFNINNVFYRIRLVIYILKFSRSLMNRVVFVIGWHELVKEEKTANTTSVSETLNICHIFDVHKDGEISQTFP